MSAGKPDDATVRSAIALAARAPSVHNTQPWRWLIGGYSVHLMADWTRHLHATDPDGRDLIVSCGAALHHLRVAFAGLGWATRVHRLPNPADPDHLASIEPYPAPPNDGDIAMTTAIARRQTDRRRFSSWPVPAGHLDLFVERAGNEGVLAVPVTDPIRRHRLTTALALAADRVDDTAETALWSGRGRSDLDGVQAVSAAPRGTVHGDTTMRAFDAGTLTPSTVDPEDTDAGELIVLATAADDTLSRLRAGEAASAILLTATELGLATCPLSQPLESAETAAMVGEAVLDRTAVPQLVLRVGWLPAAAAPLPRSRRRHLEEFTAYLPGIAPARDK
ncbi:Acg family FMN-binding oxidoreductase [Actinokineospora sp. HUAS TT18]|uniref:Acg family FMN-binding oxidoreductase n=1 Tax=Actinokineospora sp. HUAS TT18 TaxID=3447451 RepID=UPI003F520BE2